MLQKIQHVMSLPVLAQLCFAYSWLIMPDGCLAPKDWQKRAVLSAFWDCPVASYFSWHKHYNWLVVNLPLWKMMEFVSWDDEIPNWMESHKIHVPNHQPVFHHLSMVLLPVSPHFPIEIPYFPTDKHVGFQAELMCHHCCHREVLGFASHSVVQKKGTWS